MVQVTGPLRRSAVVGEPDAWRERQPRRFRIDTVLWASIVLGVVLSFAISGTVYFLTQAGRWAASALVGCLTSLLMGGILGARLWPRLGVTFARHVLHAYAFMGRRRNCQLLLTPYPDFVPSRARQMWESTAFAGAISLLVGANFLLGVQAANTALPWFSLAALGIGCGLTVLLVPHWTFARLGIRLSEQGRFVVRSVAESYSRLVRVSNGTLLVAAIAYGVAVVAGRSGRAEGYHLVGVTLVLLLGFSFLIMLVATATFRRHEGEVVARVMQMARREGYVPVSSGRVVHI